MTKLLLMEVLAECGGCCGSSSDTDQFFFQSGFFPPRAVAEQAGDEGGVHGVSGAVGDNVAENLPAEQGQIADEVENLVAHKFVFKAQGRVLDALAGQDDAIVTRSSADQSHIAELLLVFAGAKGSRRSDVAQIISFG